MVRCFLAVSALLGLSTVFASVQDSAKSPVTRIGTPSRETGDLVSAFACSPDGKTVAIGRYSGGIVLWELDSGRALRTLLQAASERYNPYTSGTKIEDIAFSPDGKYVAGVGFSLGLRVWD